MRVQRGYMRTSRSLGAVFARGVYHRQGTVPNGRLTARARKESETTLRYRTNSYATPLGRGPLEPRTPLEGSSSHYPPAPNPPRARGAPRIGPLGGKGADYPLMCACAHMRMCSSQGSPLEAGSRARAQRFPSTSARAAGAPAPAYNGTPEKSRDRIFSGPRTLRARDSSPERAPASTGLEGNPAGLLVQLAQG